VARLGCRPPVSSGAARARTTQPGSAAGAAGAACGPQTAHLARSRADQRQHRAARSRPHHSHLPRSRLLSPRHPRSRLLGSSLPGSPLHPSHPTRSPRPPSGQASTAYPLRAAPAHEIRLPRSVYRGLYPTDRRRPSSSSRTPLLPPFSSPRGASPGGAAAPTHRATLVQVEPRRRRRRRSTRWSADAQASTASAWPASRAAPARESAPANRQLRSNRTHSIHGVSLHEGVRLCCAGTFPGSTAGARNDFIRSTSPWSHFSCVRVAAGSPILVSTLHPPRRVLQAGKGGHHRPRDSQRESRRAG
jgi:hypothetical protein